MRFGYRRAQVLLLCDGWDSHAEKAERKLTNDDCARLTLKVGPTLHLDANNWLSGASRRKMIVAFSHEIDILSVSIIC